MSSTAVIQLLTSLCTLIAVVLATLQGRSTHKMVNSTAQAQTDRIDQLTQSLQGSNVDIPARSAAPKTDLPQEWI